MRIARYCNIAVATAFTSLAFMTSGHAVAQDGGGCEQAEYAMGLRYQQQSAEVIAMQRQTFELATFRLEQQIQSHGENANLAIMTDLDETIIDNGALLVRDMQACHDFTSWDTWKHWEREGQPRLIPGAKAFLDFADQHDVAIYYVSDRYQENKSDTLATLKALALPQVADDHVLLLGPPKAERRKIVENKHTLVMQLGDSLHDFSGEFGDADLKQQRALVNKHAKHFGQDWIVLPNAMYGDWSEAKLTGWNAPFEYK
ncbi:5'-nucleotidase, lipoprotein e(P4) family [Salinivibrio sp. IB872]|uniref:5'-nucleotidase, lipoprotein e(P4) family n=1 Tax=Salinivibrio sp. IB872 TaxID=1766123 RepID=UPI00098799EF|nr:HAD family acid phosphatase [Salinivibrio sp. IB872]OOF23748.1 5'-nucleotidase [Salinivibrio sp. IB872]